MTEQVNHSAEELMHRQFDRDLYELSALVDVLRDNARELLQIKAPETGSTDDLSVSLAQRYLQLRTAVSGIVSPGDVASLELWTAPAAEPASYGHVYVTVSDFARWIDVKLGVDAFVANRAALRAQLAAFAPKGVEPTQERTPTGPVGAYL